MIIARAGLGWITEFHFILYGKLKRYDVAL